MPFFLSCMEKDNNIKGIEDEWESTPVASKLVYDT